MSDSKTIGRKFGLALRVVAGIGVALLGFGLPGCAPRSEGAPSARAEGEGPAEVAGPAARAGEERLVLEVKGMTCGGCAAAIEIALKKLDGILAADADHKAGTATVTYVKDKVSVERIVGAIREVGFEAAVPENRKKKNP